LTGDGIGTSLNGLLKEMGFVWKRRINKRLVSLSGQTLLLGLQNK